LLMEAPQMAVWVWLKGLQFLQLLLLLLLLL
jgi:hypothetical protein